MNNQSNWLGVAVGNSRIHWGWFKQGTLIAAWDTQHLTSYVQPNQPPYPLLHADLVQLDLSRIPVYLASVVAEQTKYWLNYRYLVLVSLKDIKLTNLYPTFGIDRALAVSGAIAIYQQACLVIDGGTALTFTGANSQERLIGGAILPGLRSQLLSLQQKTDALPEVALPQNLPPRWALDTNQAIASGILYTATAGIHSFIVSWLRQFPHSQIVFTGGDGDLLAKLLQQQLPKLKAQTIVNQNIVLQGLKLVSQSKDAVD